MLNLRFNLTRTRTKRMVMLVFACLVMQASADLSVTVRFENETVLQYENVLAYITIKNDSGRTLVLDDGEAAEGNARLRMQIERKQDEFAPRINPRPFVQQLTIAPGQQREVVVNLSAWFDISRMGKYVVRCVVDFGEFEYLSKKLILEVVRGLEMTTLTKRLEEAGGAKRTYRLLYWPRAGSEYLFLRVDSEDANLNYGVFPLGPVVRVFTPTLDVDWAGNITVIHQTSRAVYTRSILKAAESSVRFVEQSFGMEDRKEDQNRILPLKKK